MKRLSIIILVIVCLAGLYLRLYHIEFGLPHSFYADEPEIAEPAIKYTYELKNIVLENNWYKLIPISYVYGTFPVYFFTLFTMLFSKTLNILNIAFDKTSIFIYLRVLNNLLTLFIPVFIYLLTNKLFGKKYPAVISFFIALFNWKLIVNAHYLNNDIFQAILITALSYFFYLYYKNPDNKKFTIISGVLFGLAVGTKITSLITLPLFLLIYLYKKDIKSFIMFCLLGFGIFILTNPFAIAFSQDFIYRVTIMATKEGGIVFDSVDTNPFKYFLSLIKISNIFIVLFSAYAIADILIKKDHEKFHLFMLGQIVIYLLFFSIQSRRVDRWLLPILPVIILYAGYGIYLIQNKIRRPVFFILIFFISASYLYYPVLLTKQFARFTPKSSAYLWMKSNSSDQSTKLVYTEEGLDPMNKLSYANVKKVEVYPNQNAQLYYPVNPIYFDYIIISSRPLEYYKKPIIQKNFPLYSTRWSDFENTLQDTKQYELIKEYILPKPNLIPLSDVFIYKNLSPKKIPVELILKDNL